MHQKQFAFHNVSLDIIKKINNELAPKSSFGFDRLSTKLIKDVRNFLFEPITLIVNQMISTSIFPDKLKIAKITPIFKKEDETLFTNYRPISLLPAISKIFEKVLFKQIYDYFQQKKLFYSAQYGFRTGHSTDFATIELVDRIITKLDQKNTPIGIFIDLTKAFDTIDHRILIDKLKYYGFTDPAANLIGSYLTNRMQFVQLDDIQSDRRPISTGIPQGSILGPLLFIIYMNDITEASDLFDFILYADDTSLNTTLEIIANRHPNSTQESINIELNKLNNWLKLNKLSLNIQKTKFMIFTTTNKRTPDLQLHIEGTTIERVFEFNFLGITLDDKLRWNKHIDKISNKISRNVGILNSMKHFLPIPTKTLIYNSLILSHINYGLLLWGYSCKRIETLQKKAIRIITLSKYNAHTEPLFKHLKLLKINDLLKLQTLKLYYKFKHGQLPIYLLNMPFYPNQDVHSYNTRNRNQLHHGRPKHSFAAKSLRYNLPVLVNNTVSEIIAKIDTHSFQGFSRYIKNQYICMYEEECQLLNCYICNRN